MDGDLVPGKMAEWPKALIEDCGNATMPDFADNFKFLHREDVDRMFSVLISKKFYPQGHKAHLAE